MPAFDYLALASDGRRRSGVTEADTAQQARDNLREQGLTPLEVRSEHRDDQSGVARVGPRRSRLSDDQVVLFTRLLATLLASGLPVDDALAALAKQAENRDFKRTALDIRASVLEGQSLGTGLDQFPRCFPPVYRATVAAGEQTRHLPTVLTRLADFMEERQRMTQRLELAMIYPVVLIVVALAVVSGLLAYVVPEVAKVFSEMQRELPAITRYMIALSDFVRVWGLAVAVLAVIAVAVARSVFKRPGPRLLRDRLSLRLPLVGALIREADGGRFARTLAILLGSGQTMLEALHIASRAVANTATQIELAAAIERVREGSALHQGLAQVSGFPPLLAHLVANGETSGELPKMLDSAADAHERGMQLKIAVLMGLAEPALILLMGAMVLAIVLAILLPIFDMNQLV